MNTQRNHQRPMIFRAHPALDHLEDRIQSNVTCSRDGRNFVVEAKCTAVIGVGPSVEDAVRAFISNMGLAD